MFGTLRYKSFHMHVSNEMFKPQNKIVNCCTLVGYFDFEAVHLQLNAGV